MTLVQLRALTQYWETSPPLHEAFAAFVGIKGSDSSTSAGPARNDLIPADNSADLLKDLLAAGFTMPAGLTLPSSAPHVGRTN